MLCILGLMQLYGLNTFLWLTTSALGLRILSARRHHRPDHRRRLRRVGGVNVSVANATSTGCSAKPNRPKSARLRTLLPLLRTTLLIASRLFAGLTILSEIGINVAPLLAGAGIIGVAIGFGSQKLVQDLITGIFLLLENAMQVGDFGHRLRPVGHGGGAVGPRHPAARRRWIGASDPFSAVTSVTNVNRGLGTPRSTSPSPMTRTPTGSLPN